MVVCSHARIHVFLLHHVCEGQCCVLAVLKVNGANILTATDTMFELRLPNDVTMEYQKFRPW